MVVYHFAVLLLAQFAGELIVRGLGVPVPGAVVGMALLLAVMLWKPRVATFLRPTTTALLGFLSLLFVPAGVGIVNYQEVVGGDGPVLAFALLASTVCAIVVSALVFQWLSPAEAEAAVE
ncbi:MAG: holin-like protein [Polyangiales bacterium]|jgi:holin-like protein